MTSRVKPFLIQSFLTFDSMTESESVTSHCYAIEQYVTVVRFAFQFYPVCDFGKFISFGLVWQRQE